MIHASSRGWLSTNLMSYIVWLEVLHSSRPATHKLGSKKECMYCTMIMNPCPLSLAKFVWVVEAWEQLSSFFKLGRYIALVSTNHQLYSRRRKKDCQPRIWAWMPKFKRAIIPKLYRWDWSRLVSWNWHTMTSPSKCNDEIIMSNCTRLGHSPKPGSKTDRYKQTYTQKFSKIITDLCLAWSGWLAEDWVMISLSLEQLFQEILHSSRPLLPL